MISGLELRALLWAGSLAVVIVAGWAAYNWAYQRGYETADSEWQARSDKAQADHLANVIEVERQARADIAAIEQQYSQEQAYAQSAQTRVVSDLRADNLRLRQYWTGCESARVPATAEPARITDDRADDRAASAGRIVRAAAECDAQVRGLQRVIRSWQ